MRVLGTRFGVIQRAKGQTVVARSEYGHSGITVRAGKPYVSTKTEDIITHRIFLPPEIDDNYRDASYLCSKVAAAKTRRDSVEARTLDITLPRQISITCMLQIIDEVAQIFTDLDVCCQVDLHITKAKDGGSNPHAHFLVSERPLYPEGFAAKKSAELQNIFRDNFGRSLRKRLADIVNACYRRHGWNVDLVTHLPFDRGVQPRLPREFFKHPDAAKARIAPADPASSTNEMRDETSWNRIAGSVKRSDPTDTSASDDWSPPVEVDFDDPDTYRMDPEDDPEAYMDYEDYPDGPDPDDYRPEDYEDDYGMGGYDDDPTP